MHSIVHTAPPPTLCLALEIEATGALGVSAAQALLPEEEIAYCPRGTGVTDQTHRYTSAQ
jgi:hypothetical protein